MRLVDKSSDQFSTCGWDKSIHFLLHEETICAVGMYPESKTVVFKRDPAVVSSLPVFVKDDPEVIFNEMGTPESGKTITCNHIYDLFPIESLLTLFSLDKVTLNFIL